MPPVVRMAISWCGGAGKRRRAQLRSCTEPVGIGVDIAIVAVPGPARSVADFDVRDLGRDALRLAIGHCVEQVVDEPGEDILERQVGIHERFRQR